MADRLSLKFIVVGGSIAGLAAAYALKKAGHDVSLIESSDGKPSMMSAVLAVPSATKVLQQWGLGPLIDRIAEVADGLRYLDGETGQELATLSKGFFEPFKVDAVAEFVSLPDKHLRSALYQLAEKEGVTFHFNTKAVDVEPKSGIITLSDGQRLSADLFIGADGFYSFMRGFVVEDEEIEEEESNGIEKTLLLCVSLSLEKLSDDEMLRPLSNPSLWTSWLGDGFIGQASVTEHKRMFSLTLDLHYHGPISAEDKHWRKVGYSELTRYGIDFGKLEERLQKIIKSGDQLLVKVFTNKRQTDSVVCPGSRCILVGEAAHSLIPGSFLASSLDLEDAQILGSLFSRIKDRSQLSRFVTAYDDIRHPRSSSIFQYTEQRRAAFMAPKGPKRDLRNSVLKKVSESRDRSELDEGFDEEITFLMTYADDMIEDWWSKYGSSLEMVQGSETRHSVLSNVEISVVMKTGTE